MAPMSARTLHEARATDVEQGADADTNTALIALLRAQNNIAVQKQKFYLVVTVLACVASFALMLYAVRSGLLRSAAHGASAQYDSEDAVRLAAEWRAYDLKWEECARSSECDAWNTTRAQLLIKRTRAAIQDPDKINGVPPPGAPGLSTGSPGQPFSKKPTHKMLEYVGRQPVETGISTMYAAWYNSRRVMERTPIHVHPETQFTCILNGTLMFIAEGMETKNYSSGQCYVMPGMTKMVSVNVGGAPYVDVDIFRVSAGSVPWIVVEPSALWMQSTQFGPRDQRNKPIHGLPASIHVSERA